ncbi:hypothetical protein V8G54_003552, partial [Vigna mungo]
GAAIMNELLVLDAEGAMSMVVQHTHYLPKRWCGEESTESVCAEFAILFQYTGMILTGGDGLNFPHTILASVYCPKDRLDKSFKKLNVVINLMEVYIIRNVVRWSIPKLLEEQEGVTLLVSAKFNVVSVRNIYLQFEEVIIFTACIRQF